MMMKDSIGANVFRKKKSLQWWPKLKRKRKFSRNKKQAMVTIHDDEGFNWSKCIPEEKKFAMVAEVKTKEEILEAKTYRERRLADYRIDEMQKEYDEARRFSRWDKKRECYVNHKGDPVLDSRKVVYNDILAVIPLSSEYYSKIEADKDYLKKLDKIIRDVMTVSLKKRDDERMKNSVEKLVDVLKKTLEEGSDEQKDEEVKKEEGTGVKRNRRKLKRSWRSKLVKLLM
ncbi:hypothetical protein Hdeb2414_s0001g00032601 [Helianthus debilis subsp. tardiflorus]